MDCLAEMSVSNECRKMPPTARASSISDICSQKLSSLDLSSSEASSFDSNLVNSDCEDITGINSTSDTDEVCEGRAEDRTTISATSARKQAGKMEEQDLSVQLSQLQELVREMKEGFSTAMEALSDIQFGDQFIQQKLAENKTEYEQQLTGVVQMVLSLKNEFGSVVGQLQIANESQKNLQQQVEFLQYERDVLLEELEKSGNISNNSVRSRCQSRLTEKNDHNASLSVLLEKTRTNYNTQVTSDQDSGVNTYPHGDLSSCDDVLPSHSILSSMVPPFLAALPDQQDDEDYESDSALTAAANKSLDLSRSLGDKCADFTQSDSSDEEEAESVSQHDSGPMDIQELQKGSILEPPYDEDNDDEDDSKSDSSETSSPKRPSVATPRRTSPRITTPKVMSAKKMAPHERSMQETHRSKVAREILETERKYCSALWLVIDNFSEPIKNSGYVSAKDYSVMFPMSLNRIYEYHCNLLHKLEERMLHWQWQGVMGDIFARFTDPNNIDLLKLYQTYANEFPQALNQIKKSCRQSNKFRKLLRKLQLQTCEGLDLPSFMLTPIQRIPRYVLMLKQLLKHTEASHPDFYYIETSLDKLGQFLHQLNDSIEFSMQAVSAVANSPKGVKRKLRQLSMRSNGSSTTTDPNQLSSATRDSGIHSHTDELATPLTTSRAEPKIVISQTRSHNRHIPYSNAGMYACETPSINHHSKTVPNQELITQSLPYTSKGRRKTKVKRSQSSKLPPEDIGPCKQTTSFTSRFPVIQMDRHEMFDHNRVQDGSGASSNTTRSLVDQTSGASLESRTSSSSAYSSLPDHNSSSESNMAAVSRSSLPNMKARSISAQMDCAYNQQEQQAVNIVNGDSSCGLARSMPRINKDYGIYGDSESQELKPEYQCSIIDSNSALRRSQKLGQRSKSQGDILKHAGSTESPCQQRINLSLAHSLTEDALSPTYNARQTSVALKSSTPIFTKTHVEPRDQLDGMDRSVLNCSEYSKTKELKKRKKDKPKRAIESLDDTRYRKGAANFRDSIKRIFGKRNNNKVVEVGPVKTIGFTSWDSSDEQKTNFHGLAPEGSDASHPQTHHVGFTYQDEDGDPCSSV